MNNKEMWQKYTEGLSSPQNYIDWGWRYIIAASLQRRVWIGAPFASPNEEHQPCFSNVYDILVGPPGTGKGLVIREVSYFLKYWKLTDAIKINNNTVEHRQTSEIIAESDLKNARESEMQAKNKQNNIIEPILIPVAADATTYEALVEAVSSAYRRINFVKPDNTLGIYGHSSLCFSLQELASLLRKRTDDTVNYMLGLYDCPVDYEYSTKTQGKDRVRRGCLNLIAGTTPGFMQSIFNDSLIDEGFSSRSFFIYASKNRKTQFFIPPLTDEQKEYRKILLDHIRSLTSLYGNVKLSAETYKFLDEWWKDYSSSFSKRINNSSKLVPYYARKNIHVMKVAMAEHFSESTEMCIDTECFERAIKILDAEEKNMHLAITIEGKNPLANVSKAALELLENGRKDFVSLHVDTFNVANKEQLEEALTFLLDTSQISIEEEKDTTTDKMVIYYKKKEN